MNKVDKNIVIKKSRIHGLGAFSNKNFLKGKILAKWDLSNPINLEQVKKLARSERRYVTGYRYGKYIVLQHPCRFINHSCDPNIIVKNYCEVTLRNIKKGEELTSDYSKEDIPGLNFMCNCGSDNCRGVIGNDKIK